MKKISTFFLFSAFFLTYTSAQPLFKKGTEVLIENDFIYLLQPSDRYYTSGLDFGMYKPDLIEKKILGWLFRTFFFQNKTNYSSTYGFHLSQSIYTPAKITDQKLRINDHPYASSLLLRLDKIDVNASAKIEVQQNW